MDNNKGRASEERWIALQILTDHERTKRYSNVLIKNALDAHPYLSASQKAFIKRLTEGTIERKTELDEIIRRSLKNPQTSMKLRVRCILRMAAYEIYYMDGVTDYAAVNEAVLLVQKAGLPQLSGFVNAVLRSVCREKTAMGTVTQNRGSTNVVTGGAIRRRVIVVGAAPGRPALADAGKASDNRLHIAGKSGETSSEKNISGRTSQEKTSKENISKEKTPRGDTANGKVLVSSVSEDRCATLSRRYSMPEAIVGLWQNDYGEEVTEKLLASMLEIRPVCIRFDPRVHEEEKQEILSQLRAAGVVCKPGQWLPYAYTLAHAGNVEQLPGFAEGKWTIQDESSMLVCEAAGLTRLTGAQTQAPTPQPTATAFARQPQIEGTRLTESSVTRQPQIEGKRLTESSVTSQPQIKTKPLREPSGSFTVLDLCAAPGGKSLHAAGLLAAVSGQAGTPQGEVYSFDLNRARTDLIRENAQRMRLDNLIIEEHDATVYNPDLEKRADVVLCDLPCSGLGVMTRKKDIKYHFSVEKIASLCALQKRILKNAVNYIKPGGVLIYSTCTIDKAENNQIASFLVSRLGLVPDALAPYLPKGMPAVQGNQIQLLPYLHHTDGFYIARFRSLP